MPSRTRASLHAALFCALLTAPLSAHAQQPADNPPANIAAPETAMQSPAPPSAGVLAVPVPQAAVSPAAPATPPTPEGLGDSHMARKRYQAAIESYQKAEPSAAVYNKLGIAYQMMFNLEDAAKNYKRSLKLDPKNATVLNNLGTVYDSQKNYKDAEKMYKRALKIEPHSALVLKNLGTELLARHKYKKGWEAYKAALTVDPTIFTNTTRPKVENPASVKERGAMNFYMAKGCIRAGFKEQAIAYLRQALNEGFTNPRAIIADNEFASLRGMPEFESLLESQKNP